MKHNQTQTKTQTQTQTQTQNVLSNEIADSTLAQRFNRELGTDFKNSEDIFKMEYEFSDGKRITSSAHSFFRPADELTFISYDDRFVTNQKDIIELLEHNEVLIAVKNHVVKPSNDFKEKLKLQSTHIQIVVPTLEEGIKGAMTINNPQDYQQGLFGSIDYPMTFLKINFPQDVSVEKKNQYLQNIKTWSVFLNTFTRFPNDYNGGDPLSAITESEIRTFGDHVLKALAGDIISREWLSREENCLYCAELAYMALNLGVKYPLNSQFIPAGLLPSVESEIQSKYFLSSNRNPHIEKVQISLAPDDLIEIVSEGRVIEPFYLSDMIENFIKFSVPRFHHGEDSRAYQVELFSQCRGALREMLPDMFNSKLSSKLEKKLDRISSVLGEDHQDYNSFRESIDEILSEINDVARKISKKSQTYIPPHAFIVRGLEYELENISKGLLSFEYCGHGIHDSILNAQEVEDDK